MTYARTTTATLVLAAMLTLAGCLQAPGRPGIFDRAQDANDAAPSYVHLQDDIEADSLRYVGEDADGVHYYAARGWDNQGDRYCLIVDDGPANWSTGCVNMLPVIVTISGGKQATLLPETPTHPSGELVGDFVVVG